MNNPKNEINYEKEIQELKEIISGMNLLFGQVNKALIDSQQIQRNLLDGIKALDKGINARVDVIEKELTDHSKTLDILWKEINDN